MSITGIVFEGENSFFLLKSDDNGPVVRVPVDEHPWSFDDSQFYLRVTDVYEQRRLEAEAEAGSDAVGYDEPEEEGGDESDLGSLADNFIDNTPDEEIPVMESPNSKALEEAEKRIKEERRERRKRKLRKEIEAKIEEEQKEPACKARRRILVEFSDEEDEKET